MERLTTNKPVDEMSMLELAYNSCYAKDGKAMYRDFSFNTDARDLARHIMEVQAKIGLPKDDEEFDEVMLDCLQYDPATSIVGTVALLYRNLWAMADLRETLKAYEDKQEQGLLIETPLKVGDVVYSYLRWWQKEDGIVPYQITNIMITQNKNGVWTKKYRAMWLKDGKTCDRSLEFSFDEIGERAFLTEEALARMGGK